MVGNFGQIHRKCQIPMGPTIRGLGCMHMYIAFPFFKVPNFLFISNHLLKPYTSHRHYIEVNDNLVSGSIKCGGVPMAIGVQSDMVTPALVRFGSEEMKQQFLVPTIAGDYVACLGVSETGAGSDVASMKTTAVKKGGWCDLVHTESWKYA